MLFKAFLVALLSLAYAAILSKAEQCWGKAPGKTKACCNTLVTGDSEAGVKYLPNGEFECPVVNINAFRSCCLRPGYNGFD
jgi:hypothetical protein